MTELSMQDAFLIDKVVDPNSDEFQYMLELLLTDVGTGTTAPQKLQSKGEFRYTIPYRGEPEDELELKDFTPFRFAERGQYRNGAASLTLAMADLVDLVAQAAGRKRTVPVVCVSVEIEVLKATFGSSGGLPLMISFVEPDNLLHECLQVLPDTVIFDHTTICAPVDEVLNMAYRMGVHVVDGVFPYHVGAAKGWDVVFGLGKWSYTHHSGDITVGPADDPRRLMRYKYVDYLKFIEPSRWTGNARKYGYELRKSHNGLVTYRAVYLGDADVELPRENLLFDLPLCSSDDMLLVTINRQLAAGVFTSKSNNAQDLAKLTKDYAIEVRKDTFLGCVEFLIGLDKGADIVGTAVRYITQHNYVDLVNGVQIVRCAALSYADALCVAMVCALTSFSLRYRLTAESLPDIHRHKMSAKMLTSAPLGALGRLVWWTYAYICDAGSRLYMRAEASAKEMLYGSDLIPGVCYDVYTTTRYSPELDWFEPASLRLEGTEGELKIHDKTDDVITEFLANAEKTSAPTAVRTVVASSAITPLPSQPYKFKFESNPAQMLQHVYDQAFPGNSVTQLQNVAELKRVKDVDIVTEFFGKIMINKDVAAKEQLHLDAPVRTAALPVTNTSLLDAITASAKRNFNPPDLQMQNDPWEYAKYLVNKFVAFAFEPGFDESLGASYRKDPITFNVVDYLEWRAGKDKSYRSALEAECPGDLVELNLEKYDTIVKKRIKPKLSTAAQYELSQPQVIVSLSKKDTAPFTSVFRRMFERFESALRPGLASAGRMSDDDISQWLTRHMAVLLAAECIEIDSSKYDKSQGLLARMVESLLLVRLGLDPGVMEIFADSYVGKVSSKTLGLMFISAYQMKSGAPQTMLGNIIYNMVSAMECIGPTKIHFMIAKGDDNLAWLKGVVNKTEVVDRMSSLFNLESKLITGQVWYFSSGYVVPLDGALKFVPDPIKMIELVGEIGQDPRFRHERFISFQDRVRSLTSDAAIPQVLQQLVCSRLGVPHVDIVMAIDALASMASDYSLYERTVAS